MLGMTGEQVYDLLSLAVFGVLALALLIIFFKYR